MSGPGYLWHTSVVPCGIKALEVSTACRKSNPCWYATTSGLVQFDVCVAAESVISLPPLVMLPIGTFFKIRLNDMPEIFNIVVQGGDKRRKGNRIGTSVVLGSRYLRGRGYSCSASWNSYKTEEKKRSLCFLGAWANLPPVARLSRT